MTNSFDDMLNYDPLLEAEKATGLSYKEDPGTSALGFLLMHENAERKREELGLRGDTYSQMPFEEAVDVVLDAGFTLVYAQILADPSNSMPVHFYLYWKSGFLLSLESFAWSTGNLTVNSATLQYNWMTGTNGTERRPRVQASTHWTRMAPGYDGESEDDPWVLISSLDVREGLLHKMETILSDGIVPETWLYTDRLPRLHSYAEREERREGEPWSEEFKRINERNIARINQIAEPVSAMMLAGMRGKDWDDR
ncbi:hypothetical protein SEA_CECE_233 [Microbacterium phage Cece]|nr:hypothetical protein SEA_CECE_233 [Microbacterium phage Cece]